MQARESGTQRGFRAWLSLAVIAGASSVTGCGSSKGLVPVEGRVSFNDGNPPSPGYLFFVPRKRSGKQLPVKTRPLPGSALFMTDGGFHASTFSDGDGLRPGTYEVRVECSDTEGAEHDVAGRDVFTKALLPAGFKPPDLVVPSAGPRPVRYDLNIR